MNRLTKYVSLKSQFIIFLSVVLLCLAYTSQNLQLIYSGLIAVFAALILDSIFLSYKNKKITLSESAVISGLIITFVLASDNAKWIFVVAPLLAILAKQIIRFNHKHIFNPSGFGILAVMLLFKADAQWLGSNLWYIFIPFGSYFIWNYRKFEILYGYIIGFLITFGILILFVEKSNLLGIVNYLNFFFIFVMLIEPKTTPISTLGKYLFGFGVAVLTFIFTIAKLPIDIDICSLLIFNMLTPFFNKLSVSKLTINPI